MSSKQRKIASVSIITLTALTSALCSDSVFALEIAQGTAPQYVQQKSAPPQAPSFLKQAGQKLFENAQKKVLQNVNEKIQTQQAPPVQQAPIDPLTGAPAAAVPGARKTAPPCRSWVDSQESPIACLLCIHGLGLQSNSYEYFGKEQSKRGLAVYAIDVRGFGSWMNSKGKTQVNFNDCLDDIKLSLESIRAANPGLPVYILGESMGGAIALRAASMYPELVDGLISSVPAGERFNQGKTSMKVFLNLLAGGMDLTGVGGDVVNQATKNQKLKSQWQNDPLARLNLTPQELIQFQDFMNNNHEAARKLRDMPVLLVQGNGDQLVKPEGTWELFNSVASKDKSFFAVPGEHLIFEEAQTQEQGPRDQNFRVISSWLTTKVGRRPRGGGRGSAYGGGGSGFGGGGSPFRGGPGSGPMSYINTQGLEGPAKLIESGQYAGAITELENIRTQRPNDSNVLGLLAKAYFQSGQSDKARFFFRSAMRSRRAGGDQAVALNSYLLSMSNQQAPSTPAAAAQSGTGVLQSTIFPFISFGGPFGNTPGTTTGINTSGSGAIPAAKGKVYAFYASWADQCRGVNEAMMQLSSRYGDKVDVTTVNIEDSASDPLVDKFNIGPIPTVVFVAPNGKVGSTIIGESTYNNYEQALKSITQALGQTR
ncbi:MAG: alpha/beta fold hydrolase [Cyanobacteria bacterium]|nr:alpha/beta fold hydrolase [Cyanobacteriota bacterium]